MILSQRQQHRLHGLWKGSMLAFLYGRLHMDIAACAARFEASLARHPWPEMLQMLSRILRKPTLACNEVRNSERCLALVRQHAHCCLHVSPSHHLLNVWHDQQLYLSDKQRGGPAAYGGTSAMGLKQRMGCQRTSSRRQKMWRKLLAWPMLMTSSAPCLMVMTRCAVALNCSSLCPQQLIIQHCCLT